MKVYIDTDKVFFIRKDNMYIVLHIPSGYADYFNDKALAEEYAHYLNNN